MASPVLEQLLATRILARIDEILADRRSHLLARRSALATALEDMLPGWRYMVPAGGLFIWAELPGPISTSLSVLASEHGVALTPGPRFGSPGLLERYLRLPYSLPPEQLEQAVTTIAALAPLTRPGHRKVEDKFNYAA
jgi:DNA-binding transcriptional MocR family regulator